MAKESQYEAAARRLREAGGHYASHVDRVEAEANEPDPVVTIEENPQKTGFASSPLEAGAAGVAGAYVGNKLSKAAGTYKFPDLPPNEAKLALQELEKQRLGLSGGMTDYGLKADALKRQADDLKQLHMMEEAKQAVVRDALVAAKSGSNNPAVSSLIVEPDLRTRQIQGQGSAAGQIGTGRSNQSGYQATTQQIGEHGAEGQKVLSSLQQQGMVKPHGVAVEFPGITYSSPTGVLTPASGREQIERMARQIIESNLPQEQKLAALQDLHKQTSSQTGSAYSKFATAEANMLEHANNRQVVLDPLQRAVQQGEERLTALGGERAANKAPSYGMRGALAKIPGALTGAGAAITGAEAYERAQQGDALGSKIAGAGAALESLGVLPHPVAKGVALAGGLSSAALLTLYDMYGPEVLKYLEKQGLYSPSVMK